jgi:hypothetical protein
VDKKNIILFFLCSFISLFILNTSFVFALEINDYPNIPGIDPPTDLPTLAAYFFGFGAYIAGAIAVISFAVGAVQFSMAAASPSVAKEGKDRMIGSILGLILTISAVVILTTINPKIAEIDLTPLPATDGVYYAKGQDLKSAPTSEANTANIEKGYETLFYKCSSGPVLLIWKYPKTNFQGNDENYSGVKVIRKTCGESESLSDIGSFKWSFETPGIYYCMGNCTNNMCSGYMSEATASSGVLPDPFKNNLSSIRIVNDLATDLHYGVIFHGNDDHMATGECSNPLYSTNTTTKFECFTNISVSASSTVYFWNHKDFLKSGQGVDFYSEPFGWAKGARAGEYSASAQIINNFWEKNPGSFTLNYSGIERPDGYKNLYKTFQQRMGSINIKGNYMVILWSGAQCQVFFKNINNLKSTEITAPGNVFIDKINVIPVK